MFHRPVCVKCQTEYRPAKNGVSVCDMASFGPYKIWQADMYECPKCKSQIIVGFAEYPIAEHYEEFFNRYMQKIPNDFLFYNREYIA